MTVYPSTYDDDGIETLEIHSNYHWIPHIPAMMRELSEDYEEVFFGSTRSTVSHATQHRYDAFVKEREKYIEDELKVCSFRDHVDLHAKIWNVLDSMRTSVFCGRTIWIGITMTTRLSPCVSNI